MSAKQQISVVTLVRGRQQALKNLISGLCNSSVLPSELVIIHMNEQAAPLPDVAFPLRQIELSSAHQLPLAAARNRAMLAAGSEWIVFLDVDCIPASDLIEKYEAAFREGDMLFTGPVRYLHEKYMSNPDLLRQLELYSAADPVRGQLNSYSYELFWSLNFGCSKAVFDRIGGFDESYTGYGAEDTDFAFQASKAEVPLKTVNATAYHQYHASYDPPLNHLADIVANASKFHEKWGLWPMQGWLKKFAELGYVSWSNDKLNIIMDVEEEVLERYKK